MKQEIIYQLINNSVNSIPIGGGKPKNGSILFNSPNNLYNNIHNFNNYLSFIALFTIKSKVI